MLNRFLLSALIVAAALALIYYLIRQANHSASQARGGRLREWTWRGLLRPLVNPLLQRLGLNPLWLAPSNGPEIGHIRALLNQTASLLSALREALRNSHQLPAEQSRAMAQQALESCDNMVDLSWSLHRIRRLQVILPAASADSHKELDSMAQHLLSEMEGAVKLLEQMPVSVLRLELEGGEDDSAQLLDDLQESNQRMRDLIRAHKLRRHIA